PHLAPPIHYQPGAPPGTPVPAVPEKKEKKEKPKTKTPIEGTDWTKVVTNKGNTFWTNRVTKESVWTIPDEIKDLAVPDVAGKKRKAGEDEGDEYAEDVAAGESVEVELEGDEPELLTVSDAAPVPAPETEKVAEPKKKRKRQNNVVREIEELEQDEDWQRQIASQMAAEAEAEDAREQAEAELELRTVPEAREGSNGTQNTPTPTTGLPIRAQPQAVAPTINEVSREEAAAMFKAMLGEKDISPMAPWDMELPKLINDSRYSAVKLLKDRRDLFDEFCKEKIRDIRAAKKAAQEAGGPKVDVSILPVLEGKLSKLIRKFSKPMTGYRALLLTAVTSTRTHFSDFKRAHAKDPRFREFGKTEGEREKVFKAWLRELGERKRAEATKAEERFVEMLKSDSTIKQGDKWADVKSRHVSDPRYDAVNSSSLRESLFNKHVDSLEFGAPGGPPKADKAARAAASLREREEQVRLEKERMSRTASAARGAAGREEGEREFNSLLTDLVRDHEAPWDAVLPTLRSDPRFSSSPLSPLEQRRLFDQHQATIYTRRVASVEALFLSSSPSLDTPFLTVLSAVSDSPQVTRLVGEDHNRLEGLWNTWKTKREASARREFDELLKESPVIQHWGRLQKKGEEESGMKAPKDEDEDEDDAALDIGEMAKQVDIKAVHAVLKSPALSITSLSFKQQAMLFSFVAAVSFATADGSVAAGAEPASTPASTASPPASDGACSAEASTATASSAPPASTAAASTTALDLGSCSDPSIVFDNNLDGRTQPAFIAADQTNFNHGSALNIGVIASFIQQQLSSKCKAGMYLLIPSGVLFYAQYGTPFSGADAIAAAGAAVTAASAAGGGKTGESADAFNAAFGITTNFAAAPGNARH
ncbi:transcription elongation regulator 1, partial [Phenoliferia sp. Uapishka_3]